MAYVGVPVALLAQLGCGPSVVPAMDSTGPESSETSGRTESSAPPPPSDTFAESSDDATTSESSSEGSTSSSGGDPQPLCGNGEIDRDEVCDDGNDVVGDGCNPDCNGGGLLVWEVALDRALRDAAYGVAIDSADRIVVVGRSNYSGWIGVLDQRGSIAWEDADASLDESIAERFYGVALGADGDAFVTGVHADRAVVRSYSSDGVILWEAIMDVDPSAGYHIVVDANGDVLVLHVLEDPSRGVLTKLSSAGEEIWTYDLGNDPVWPSHAIGVTPSGDITLAWREEVDLVVRRLSPDLDELWSTTLAVDWYALDLAHTPDDHIVIGGPGAPSPMHAHLAYYTSDGAPLWERIWNDDPNAYLTTQAVAIDGDGRPIAVGLHQPAAVSAAQAPFARKLDAEGGLVWQYTKRFPAEGGDVAFGVAVDGTEHVVVVGARRHPMTGGEDIWIAKLTP